MKLKLLKSIVFLVSAGTLTFMGISQPSHANTPNLGLDLGEYCSQKYGVGWGQQLYNEQKAAGWRCVKGSGAEREERGINMDEACSMKYGNKFIAQNNTGEASGWYCDIRR